MCVGPRNNVNSKQTPPPTEQHMNTCTSNPTEQFTVHIYGTVTGCQLIQSTVRYASFKRQYNEPLNSIQHHNTRTKRNVHLSCQIQVQKIGDTFGLSLV